MTDKQNNKPKSTTKPPVPKVVIAPPKAGSIKSKGKSSTDINPSRQIVLQNKLKQKLQKEQKRKDKLASDIEKMTEQRKQIKAEADKMNAALIEMNKKYNNQQIWMQNQKKQVEEDITNWKAERMQAFKDNQEQWMQQQIAQIRQQLLTEQKEDDTTAKPTAMDVEEDKDKNNNKSNDDNPNEDVLHKLQDLNTIPKFKFNLSVKKTPTFAERMRFGEYKKNCNLTEPFRTVYSMISPPNSIKKTQKGVICGEMDYNVLNNITEGQLDLNLKQIAVFKAGDEYDDSFGAINSEIGVIGSFASLRNESADFYRVFGDQNAEDHCICFFGRREIKVHRVEAADTVCDMLNTLFKCLPNCQFDRIVRKCLKNTGTNRELWCYGNSTIDTLIDMTHPVIIIAKSYPVITFNVEGQPGNARATSHVSSNKKDIEYLSSYMNAVLIINGLKKKVLFKDYSRVKNGYKVPQNVFFIGKGRLLTEAKNEMEQYFDKKSNTNAGNPYENDDDADTFAVVARSNANNNKMKPYTMSTKTEKSQW